MLKNGDGVSEPGMYTRRFGRLDCDDVEPVDDGVPVRDSDGACPDPGVPLCRSADAVVVGALSGALVGTVVVARVA